MIVDVKWFTDGLYDEPMFQLLPVLIKVCLTIGASVYESLRSSVLYLGEALRSNDYRDWRTGSVSLNYVALNLMKSTAASACCNYLLRLSELLRSANLIGDPA